MLVEADALARLSELLVAHMHNSAVVVAAEAEGHEDAAKVVAAAVAHSFLTISADTVLEEPSPEE